MTMEKDTMTKADLIKKVQEAAGKDLSKEQVKNLVEATFEAVRDSLVEEGKFSYPKFGTFTVKERAARQGRNPKTGETITIMARKAVTFKPATDLKESVN